MNNNIKHLPNGDFQTLPDTGQPGGGGGGCISPQLAATVLHSPCLNICDYGADNDPDSGALVSSSFHEPTNS